MKWIINLFGMASLAVSALSAPTLAEAHDKTLVIGSTQVPRHLNGAVQSGTATGLPSTQIFASLLRYDTDWTPEPYLAKSWKFSDDGLSLTLHLVENAKFSDGVPLTSADVAFSIMAIKKNHPFKSMFASVTGVDTPDPYTAIIRLSAPHPALLLALSPVLAPILPKHIFGESKDIKTDPANKAPIGAGPFMVEKFDPGHEVVLKRNPYYFIKDRPKLDEIIIRIIRDSSALRIATENGEVDMYPYIMSTHDIRQLEKSKRLIVTDKGYDAVGPVNWLAFNTKDSKLKDVRVRQAIAYAIDRNFITNALMRGVAKQQRGPISESSPFFDPTIPAYDLDLKKAKELMKEAGHVKGMTLTVDFIPGVLEQQKSVAEYLKSQLKKIGINVTVRAAPDFPTWAKRVSNYDFEMSMDLVFNWGDPVIGVHRTFLCSNIRKGVVWSNTQQYCNKNVDKLLNEAAVEIDPTKRKMLYNQFQQIVAKDLPIYWLNAVPFHTAYDKRLKDMPVGIWGVLSPLDQVHWSK